MRRFVYVWAALLALCAVPAAATGSGKALRLGTTGSLAAPLPTGSVRNVTIEMWVRLTKDSASSILLYIGNGRTDGFGLVMHDGIGGGAGNSCSAMFGNISMCATGTSASLPVGRWTHIALSRGDSEWKLYRNGALVGRTAATPNPPSGTLLVGPGFDGDVDEIRVWDVERSQEEILSTLSHPLTGAEKGLTLHFNMNDGQENVVRNDVSSVSAPTLDATLTGPATFIECDRHVSNIPHPVVSIESFATHMQFVPRGLDGFGTFRSAGRVVTPGFDSVAVEVSRNGQPYAYQTLPLQYTSSGASFGFDSRIRAELAEYTLRLFAIKGGDRVMLAEGADLVAGDVFLIAGQSNSHWSDRTITTRNRYLRSYGVQTQNENLLDYTYADTMWGLANVHGFGGAAAGPLLTGAWGFRIQEHIAKDFGIPVCIINGGAGGSTIEMNLPPTSPFDSTSIYGRMLYRTDRAGLRQSAKAMFWYQGESNTFDGYAANFRKIYEAWHRDYPNLERVYVTQIRPGCVRGPHGALREFQRTLADTFPDVTVVTTAGLIGHDGCHYAIEGYMRFGDQLYRHVARDFYGSKDTVGVNAPNLRHAFFTDATRSEIALVFRSNGTGILWPQDTVVADTLRSMANAFYLDGVAGDVVAGRSSGDTIFLTLRSSSTAETITYLPDLPWYDNSNVVYEGPWLFSGAGIGAFSFYKQPILEQRPNVSRTPEDQPIVTGVEFLPNPASSSMLVRFDAGNASSVDVTIMDLSGITRLHRKAVGTSQLSIDLSDLPPGTYLCRTGSVTRSFSIVR